MGKIKNKKLFVTIVSLIVVATLSVLFFGYWVMYSVIEFLTDPFPVYETTNIEDYRVVRGTDNEDEAKRLLEFFPYEIKDYFEDVTYSFKAQKCGVYSFEAYLEFTISDKAQYDEYIKSAIKWRIGQPFEYDPAYTEYLVSDVIQPNFSVDVLKSNRVLYQGNEKNFDIDYCDVRKILCNAEEQRVIFVAICVDHEGFTSTELYSTFFERFDIHPREYAAPRYHCYSEIKGTTETTEAS